MWTVLRKNIKNKSKYHPTQLASNTPGHRIVIILPAHGRLIFRDIFCRGPVSASVRVILKWVPNKRKHCRRRTKQIHSQSFEVKISTFFASETRQETITFLSLTVIYISVSDGKNKIDTESTLLYSLGLRLRLRLSHKYLCSYKC